MIVKDVANSLLKVLVPELPVNISHVHRKVIPYSRATRSFGGARVGSKVS